MDEVRTVLWVWEGRQDEGVRDVRVVEDTFKHDHY
jgi:hypothetical protein